MALSDPILLCLSRQWKNELSNDIDHWDKHGVENPDSLKHHSHSLFYGRICFVLFCFVLFVVRGGLPPLTVCWRTGEWNILYPQGTEISYLTDFEVLGNCEVVCGVTCTRIITVASCTDPCFETSGSTSTPKLLSSVFIRFKFTTNSTHTSNSLSDSTQQFNPFPSFQFYVLL